MSHPDMGQPLQRQQEGALPPPPGVDTEAGTPRPQSNFKGVSNIESHVRWNKEDWVKKGALVLIFRVAALLFSFLSFILMVTIEYFTLSSTACYVFSVALIVIVYTTIFIGIRGHELRTGEVVIPHETAVWLEVFGDHIMAILALTAASAGAAVITEVRAQTYNHGIFDQVTASVSMAFLAYFSLQPAALISTYIFSVYISKL